MESKYNIQ